MASSAPIIDSCDNYDVFLSFRGADTRYNFTSHLYDALCRSDIKAFIDYKIDRGDEITPALERVIERASISIIIFSSDYASSPACLHELVKIMECRRSKAQLVLPIFYQVEPSEATYQEAFDRHKAKPNKTKRSGEETIEEELKKVEKWKSALHEALKLAGWHIKKDSDEVDFIGKITKTISENLNGREELMCTSIVGGTAEETLKKVWKCLMNDNISRVGIYGMGGVGKTTIATRINDELLRTNAFNHVCWVTVSKEFSVSKLQIGIAKMMNLDLSKEDDERKRAAKLKKRLKTEKFVLILDDVWKAFEAEEVGIPPLVSGQKLLLTSRSRRVCEGMECQPIELTPLLKQEALDLFIKESKHKIHDSVEWREIVLSIVTECAGLPLAIVVIARRMRGVVEISEWRNVLRKLKEPCKGENHELEEEVFKPLKLSYDSLPDYHYQQCFLYYSLFPEDHRQSCDSLIEYLIGEGLVGKLDSRQAELDHGNAIINGLINVSLLEPIVNIFTMEKFIKMHDVVRDMAQIVIRENLKAQDGSKLQSLSEKTDGCVNLKGVLVMKPSMLKEGVPNLASNSSKLTTFLFNHGHIRELPSCLFANMQNLAVLDMCIVDALKLLPDSISYLGNLRVLRLHRCRALEYIPSLAGLKNLLHLDLSCTNLKEIPKDIEGLTNLRVLKLSFDHFLNAFFPAAFLEKLHHLQVLQLERVEVEADVLFNLKKLETLKMVFYNLRSLNSYFKSGHWKRLKEYYIVYLQIEEIYGSMELRKVDDKHKRGSYIVERLLDGIDIVLPNNIEKLVFGLWDDPMVDVVTNSTFKYLRVLKIDSCKGIQHLFTPALVQGVLLNVELLSISRGSEMEEMISTEEEELVEENNNDTTIQLPKLKFLILEVLRNLKSIYKGRMVCPSLECIDIDDCGKLERLPLCVQEEQRRNKHKLIRLIVRSISADGWWETLQWDHPNAKSMYQVSFGKYSSRTILMPNKCTKCLESQKVYHLMPSKANPSQRNGGGSSHSVPS